MILWITGLHHQAVKEFGEIMDWEEIVMEGYCILNEECKAAKLTSALTNATTEEVKAYAMMAEKMFHLPIFYLEYSGRYGDPQLVSEVKRYEKTVLLYGGEFHPLNKLLKWLSMQMLLWLGTPFMIILNKR
jgi:putative glycerol-1-phosphate prenyltransferase